MIAFPTTNRTDFTLENPFVDIPTGKAFVWEAASNRWNPVTIGGGGDSASLTPLADLTALANLSVTGMTEGKVMTAYSAPGQLSFYSLTAGAAISALPGRVSAAGGANHWIQIL